MKRQTLFLSVVFIPFIMFFSSCSKDDTNKGTLNLSITDAPIDSDGITGVYITVSEVHYHTSLNNWAVFEDFEGPKKFNLLELTRGNYEMLGSFEMEAGKYTQLRFILDAPIFDMGPVSNPGCYLEFEDESIKPLYAPSTSQTGYKAIGAFTVPINGSVDITADFDVRKSVIWAGISEIYILNPTIRLIVNDQAGQIAGDVINIPEGLGVVIYAYEENTYNNSEADDPAEEESRFPNAITSDMVDEDNSYYLAFLALGKYDLVVVATINGNYQEVLGVVEDVVVESNKTTNKQIDIDNL